MTDTAPATTTSIVEETLTPPTSSEVVAPEATPSKDIIPSAPAPAPNVDELKSKIAEYERNIKELQDKASALEQESSEYRGKKSLLSLIEGLSPSAIQSLKAKDVWSLIDAMEMKDEDLLETVAKGRPQISVEDRIAREFEKLKQAETKAAEQRQKEQYQKLREGHAKNLSDWLDKSTVEPEYENSHAILKFIREEKDMPVEQVLIDMVEKRGITYGEAVNVLAKEVQEKVLRYTSLKSLDLELSKKYDKNKTQVSGNEELTSDDKKEKEVIKTLEAKIESAPKTSSLYDDDGVDETTLPLDALVARLKRKEAMRIAALRKKA
jgi:hypothetical protein